MISKKEICSNVDASTLYSQDCTSFINKTLKEGEKEIGTVLYVQPSRNVNLFSFLESCIGLALCNEYVLPQQPWSVDSTSVTPVH